MVDFKAESAFLYAGSNVLNLVRMWLTILAAFDIQVMLFLI